jgi:hypothetical protein
VAAFGGFNNDGMVVVEYTVPSDTDGIGAYKEIIRFGANTDVATDGAGSIFYSIGAYNGVEQFACVKVLGDGTDGKLLWDVAFNPPGGRTNPPNFTTHIGVPTYINGKVFMSFYNEVVSLNANTGDFVARITNPCGEIPQSNEYFVFDFMSFYEVKQKSGTPSFALAVFTNTKNSTTLCAFSTAGTTITEASWSNTLVDGFIVTGVVSLPHQNVVVVQTTYTIAFIFLVVYDDATGLERFTLGRSTVAGGSVAGLPNTNFIVTNFELGTEITTSIVSTSSGAQIANCGFAFYYFKIFTASDNANYIVGNLMTAKGVVRAAKLNPAANGTDLCQVLWEMPANAVYGELLSISDTLITGGSSPNTVSLGFMDGTVVSAALF